MLITIRNGKAELRNDNGGLVRTMGSSNVVSVSMSSELELVGIVYASGKAGGLTAACFVRSNPRTPWTFRLAAIRWRFA